MRDFRIEEISSVDFPAQKGAVMTLMKRNDADDDAHELTAIVGDLDAAMAGTMRLSASDIAKIEERLGAIEKARSRDKEREAYADLADADDGGRDKEGEAYTALADDKGDDAMDPENLDAAARRLRARNKRLSKTEALSKARQRWPHLYEQYQREGIEKAASALARAELTKRNAPEVAAFEQFVDRVQERDGCSRLQALNKAATEYPRDSFEKYRRALD